VNAKIKTLLSATRVGAAPDRSQPTRSSATTDPLLEVAARAAELRARYRLERDKRVQARPEGERQFKALSGEFADFDRDPFADPNFSRPPVVEEIDVAIMGAGFGGMMAAAHLFKSGIHNYRIIDKAGDFGGTWYWNRYPGCMCDVESYCYLPLLEEMGYMPKHRYSHANEIFEYCQALGRRFEMYPKALFQTEIKGMVWDEATARWTVTTSRGDQLSARFVVLAGGILHKAKLPGVPGIRDFRGRIFHTSRWDYAYTGGGPEQPMDKLRDKRVAVIGTGATAVQVVPKLAEAAKHLYVFQRTPSAIGHRGQRETDPAWFQEMASKPGWQDERSRNFIGMITGKNPAVDMVADGWTKLYSTDTRQFSMSRAERERLELVDFRNMDEMRARIDEIVEDPATAEALKPWYAQLCKRPCFHDDYLPAFNRDNVTLVDTEGLGVERITPQGVVVRGVEYPVDLIVFASGFELGTDLWQRLGFDPVGAGGVPMSKAWQNGPEMLHGVVSRGLPNLFINSYTQGGQSVNFSYTITETSRHIVYLISRCLEDGVVRVEPKLGAAYDWLRVIVASTWRVAAYALACTPGSYNLEGIRPSNMRAAIRASTYSGSALDWMQILDKWRKEGTMRGLKLTRRRDSPR
jgi:cyclohexanone monooxygenase